MSFWGKKKKKDDQDTTKVPKSPVPSKKSQK